MEDGVARSIEQILARASPQIALLPRLAALVEGEGGGESRAALESLLDSLALSPRGEVDLGSVEYHETLALWHLLGRRGAELSCSAAEGARFVESLLDSLGERFDRGAQRARAPHLGEHARRAILGAFLEGFVLAREEISRRELERRAINSVQLRALDDGVELLVLAGAYPHPALGARLAECGRELFRREARALILDGGQLDEPRLHRDGLHELVALAEALGVSIALVDARGELGALLGRSPLMTLPEALAWSRTEVRAKKSADKRAKKRAKKRETRRRGGDNDGRGAARLIGVLRIRLRALWRAG